MQDQALFSRNALERLSEQIGPALRARRATDSGTRLWLRAAKCRIEAAGSRGTGESSDRLPPLASDGSGLSAAHPAKAGLEEPVFGLSSRGASSADAAAPAGVAAKQVRQEMAPQRPEKVQFAPGSGMAPADLDPNIWYWGERRPSPRRVPAASRPGPPQVAESCTIWRLRCWNRSRACRHRTFGWMRPDEMETPRWRLIAGMATRFADNDDVLKDAGLAVAKLQILAPKPLKRNARLQTVRMQTTARA